MPGYRQDKTEDIAAAKKLLADAGFGNGMPPIELLSASVAPHAEVLAPAFQDQLKRTLGIETKIRVVERSLLIEEQKNGNFEMVLDTPGHLISDISPLANSYWKTGGSRNFGGYSNPDFDAKLKAYDVETNDAEAARSRHRDAEHARREPAVVPDRLHVPPADVAVVRQGPGARQARRSRSGAAWTPPGWTSSAVQRYLLSRAIYSIPTIIGITILIFIAMRVIPGDPLAMVGGEGSGDVHRLTDEELAGGPAQPGARPAVRRPVPELDVGRRAPEHGHLVLARRADHRHHPAARPDHGPDRADGDRALLADRRADRPALRDQAQHDGRLRGPGPGHRLHGDPELLDRAGGRAGRRALVHLAPAAHDRLLLGRPGRRTSRSRSGRPWRSGWGWRRSPPG